ncbi:MAG: NAD(P)/FAD-dependent oxidoreductase [Pseudolabrys sp.]|nr:NAD(P)/FAD-dependent oxidoreductase [Pseudolabrys sp.]
MISRRIVIVGAGFGGLACAKELAGTDADVTLIDRRNYHLFVPLLYQVATAALSPADIARPIRRIFGRYRNIHTVLGEVTAIDTAAKTIRVDDGHTFPYDVLVLATGSQYSYFGHPEWQRFAEGPRTLDEARRIRTRLLTAFERAEAADDAAERDRLMTIVIVGGGPTGVEMAGAVGELTRHALARDFRHIDPRRAHVLLIEAGPRLLPSFPKSLSDYAKQALERLGVTVMLSQPVQNIDAGGVMIGGKRVAAGTVVWGAGVQASNIGRLLKAELARGGQILVDTNLAVRGLSDVYALGDVALTPGDDGRPLPALAQVAKQQGEYLGRALAESNVPVTPFRFHNRGDTAVIGRNAAVFDFGRFQVKGYFAWLLWALIHVYLLVGFENRLGVVSHWVWNYLTYERGARLIMEESRGEQNS